MLTPAGGGRRHALPWAGQLDTDNLDEIVAAMWRQRDQCRVPHRKGPLGYRARWLVGEQVAIGHSYMRIGQTIRAACDHAMLHLGPPPGTTYRVGRRTFAIHAPGMLTLAPQGWEVTRYSVPGATWSLGLDQGLLAAELAARSGASDSGSAFGVHVTRLEPDRMAALHYTIRQLLQASRAGGMPQHFIQARARLVSQLCDGLMPGLALTRPAAVSRKRMADLEAWIEANLEAPLTLGRLCQQAGVGERSLQKAFEQQRGMSPMRFVTERRLEAAHRRLAQGAHGVGVTRVAMDLGFEHLGRFSTAYRMLFGQSPSESLRMAAEAESG